MSITFCNKQFNSVLLNASGNWVSDNYQVENLNNNQYVSGIVLKTCTIESRQGNPWPNFIDMKAYCINNMGLPNNGYEYYSKMRLYYKDKPIILSIDGSNPDDTKYMLEHYSKSINSGHEIVEINISCPNIKSTSNKPIAMSKKLLADFLNHIFKKSYNNLYIGLKLPPYFYDYQINGIANIINQFPVNFITCSNTIPNALNIEPFFKGGLSGLKPIALSNIVAFKKYLNTTTDIIGCGGIESSDDVKDYLKCGAKLVQIGTGYIRNKDIFNIIGCKL